MQSDNFTKLLKFGNKLEKNNLAMFYCDIAHFQDEFEIKITKFRA